MQFGQGMSEKNPEQGDHDEENGNKLNVSKNEFLTGMKEYLKSADLRDSEYEESIKHIIMKCGCENANPPKPHPVVSITFPAKEKSRILQLIWCS